MFDEKYFFIQAKTAVKKMSKLYTFFLESTYPEKQRKVYPEYMNINRQPAATRLMINIKHQPDRILVDV